MGRKKYAGFEDSARINMETYNDILNRLIDVCINSIGWRNLPDTVDERFLESTLFYRGVGAYFNDEYIGNLFLQSTLSGRLDVYNMPIWWRAYAVNRYQKYLNKRTSVLIWNTFQKQGSLFTVKQFARRLYEIQRAIDVNVKGQKTPVLILSTEQQRLTMKNLYMQYDGNYPFIFGDKNLDLDGVQVLNTTSPYVSDKLKVLWNQIYNDFLTWRGIENSNQDKKERLVADEVNSNYGSVEVQRNIFLNPREQAAKKINKMFGTNIEPYFRSNVITTVNAPQLTAEELYDEGGEYNG